MIAYDAQSIRGVVQNNFSFTHTPVGNPRGATVILVQWGSVTDDVSAVTYGGVAMTRLPGADGFRTLASGETGAVYIYHVGAGLPSGPQSVAVTAGAVFKCAICNTVTAASDTEVDASSSAAPGIVANPSLSVPTTTGRQTEIFYGLCSGLGSVITTAETGSTHQGGADVGLATAMFARKTHTGGTTTIGYTASSDDVCHGAVAIGEVAGGTVDFPPQGVATASGISPSGSVGAPQGVAVAGGVTPAASQITEAAGVAVAVATGIAPSEVIPMVPGVAVALGIAPGQRAGVAPGVAVATGITPSSAAQQFLEVGSASGLGVAPSAAARAPAGAAATVGVEPGAAAAVTPGAFAAAGQPASTAVGVPPAAAIATGVTPSSTTYAAAGVGVAVATGLAATVSVPAGTATATGDHTGPSARTQLTMSLATALGVDPTASVPVGTAVAVATGITVGETIIFVFPTHSSGHKPGGGGGSLGGVGVGHIQQPIRGSAR